MTEGRIWPAGRTLDMPALTDGVRKKVENMIFANDVVLCGNERQDVEN